MPDDVKAESAVETQAQQPTSGTELTLLPPKMGAITQGEVAPIIPTTLEDAMRMAKFICAANLAPASYQDAQKNPDPQKIVVGILKALEVGMAPITGLSNIAIINNRPCIWGDGAMGLVQAKGLIERFEETFEGDERAAAPKEDQAGDVDHTPGLRDFGDDYTAICRIWRRGQTAAYEGRFSVRDAKRAHLWGNSKKIPWIEHPKRMLKMRARAFALRDGFADALAGLSIAEEVQDLPTPPAPAANTRFLDAEATEAPKDAA